MYDKEYWIENLDLKKHPEGGYFKETYRSDELINHTALPSRYGGDRAISTAIYFMVSSDSPSKFHKVNSDELWFYHAGGSLIIYTIDDLGTLEKHFLGCDFENNERPQILITKNTWFAAHTCKNDYVLLSCTVSPGFDFLDFELGNRNSLIGKFPDHADIINKLT